MEYFEWYDLEIEKITYSVSNGALITDDVFWYAMTSAANEEDYISEDSKTGNFTIPYQAPEQSTGQISGHSDYSNYADRAQLNSPDSVYSFFRKGRFGAYVTGKELLSE